MESMDPHGNVHCAEPGQHAGDDQQYGWNADLLLSPGDRVPATAGSFSFVVMVARTATISLPPVQLLVWYYYCTVQVSH